MSRPFLLTPPSVVERLTTEAYFRVRSVERRAAVRQRLKVDTARPLRVEADEENGTLAALPTFLMSLAAARREQSEGQFGSSRSLEERVRVLVSDMECIDLSGSMPRC